jgi:hypothetical protein
VAMFIVPLSLGFLVGRNRPQVSPAFSASFATALHTSGPHVVPSPPTSGVSIPQPTPGVTTPPSTPLVFPSNGKTNARHNVHNKHKHKPHKHGDDQENTFDT